MEEESNKYDASLVPNVFGLQNTGVICFFNSFLQSLISAPAFIKVILNTPQQTPTGQAIYKFINMINNNVEANQLSSQSSEILKVLMMDLARLKPKIIFGNTQESASEALIHLIDMIEPKGGTCTNLFLNRTLCTTKCAICNNEIKRRDTAVNFNMFYDLPMCDDLSKQFSDKILCNISKLEDYKCEKCNQVGISTRKYQLTLIPDIIYCMFNIYNKKKIHYFPQTFKLPAINNDFHNYKVIAQIEHSGSLSGGHYWMRGLRKNKQVYNINDNTTSPSTLEPTANTYIVVYHLT